MVCLLVCLFVAEMLLLLGSLLLGASLARASQISDLKSKLSGVEELLEEFRKQLQQDDAYQSADDAGDACLSDFDAAEERIIRAMASIERGAAFLSAPGRVYGRRDCARACCAEPRCTTAIVQERQTQTQTEIREQQQQTQEAESGDAGGLRCYLFNCTYGGASVCVFAFQRGFSTFSRVARNVSASRERHRRPLQAEEEEEQEDEDGDSSMRGTRAEWSGGLRSRCFSRSWYMVL